MADKPVAVPLVELLRSVPLDAVLRIDTPNALGVDTRSIPVGRMCHEAADALRSDKEIYDRIADRYRRDVWEQRKAAAWAARDLQNCRCDHIEYCGKCWPVEFRKGGEFYEWTGTAGVGVGRHETVCDQVMPNPSSQKD